MNLVKVAVPPISFSWMNESSKELTAGIIGGGLGKLIEYPFDTIKVRLQLQGSVAGSLQFAGPWDCLKRSVRYEGVGSLFTGMASPLVATAFETACLFAANRQIKQVLTGNPNVDDADVPLPTCFLSGAMAGATVSFLLTPIELIKCRLQHQQAMLRVGQPKVYNGPLDCVAKSVRVEGLSVLYRGHAATMAREIPGTAMFLGGYEAFLRLLMPTGAKREDHPGLVAAAGALGGMLYWGAFFPADTVKSAMQSAGPEAAAHTNNFGSMMKHIHKQRGISGLFAGFSPTMVRAALGNAAVFLAYERIRKYIDDHSDPL